MRTLFKSSGFALAILATTVAGKAQSISRDYDGSYAGSMTLLDIVSQASPDSSACVHIRSVSMQIDRGGVIVWYIDQAGNVIHFRGAVDDSGAIDAWHRNGDGSHSILLGGSGGPGFIGYLDRDDGRCRYKIVMTAPHTV